MAATKRDVEIALKARDAYSAEFDKLNARINGMRSSAVKGMADTSTAVDQLARSFRAFGAVQGIFNVATSAINLFKGDFQSAVDELKRLPFGIGPVVQAIESFESSILGVTAAEERLKKVQADLLIQQRQLADRRKEVAGNEQSIERIREQARKAFEIESIPELDPEGTTGFRRKFKELNQEREAAVKALDALAREKLTVRQEKELLETRRLVYDLFGLRQIALRMQQQEEIKAMRERAAEETRLTEERLNKTRDAIRKQAFDRREDLRLEAEEARRKALASITPVGVGAFDTRFLIRAPQSFFTEANSQEARRITELKAEVSRLKEVVDGAAASLETIVRDRTIIRVENN